VFARGTIEGESHEAKPLPGAERPHHNQLAELEKGGAAVSATRWRTTQGR
jgi:hypothetical protein